MNLSRYLEVLRAPGVARVAVFALLGRLPFGTLGLSILLLMREEHYGYGQIGAVLAAESLAVAATAIVAARLIDRLGQTLVLLVTGGVVGVTICGLAVAITGGAPVWTLVLLAAVQGAAIPPVSPSMRTLWQQLVPEERLETAYAFDSVALELAFIVGPLIAAGLAAAWSPLAGVLLCAALYSGAAYGFASAPASRAWRPAEDVERTRAGALRSPGMRVLVIVAVITAVSFGVLEVALTAFAEDQGSRAAVGPLVTVWALGSVVGGLVYGARSWQSSPARRFVFLSALLALANLPLPLAESLVVMAILLVGTGLALAPLGATEYALIAYLTPVGTVTEGYSWLIVANTTGTAAGAFLAGVLVDHASLDWALGSAAIACVLALLAALAGRRNLVAPTPV
ncbi:MAG TPA: MFS transporter [Thermoleophilaceae bacterium]